MLLFRKNASQDIYANLAMEDALLEAGGDNRLLMLWTADDAVVLGKNQNPWIETNPSILQHEGIKLARRVSGGGAVFHDTGNLNYSIFLPRWTYQSSCVHEIVVRALRSLGFDASGSDEKGITVGDKKVGGSAFCYRKDWVLHHGTLLVSANLEKLNHTLEPFLTDIESHCVRSKRAEVRNLGCEMSMVEQALRSAFETAFDMESRNADLPELNSAGDVERFKSSEWIYGRTPRFTCQSVDGPFVVAKGVIESGPDSKWVGRPFEEWLLSGSL